MQLQLDLSPTVAGFKMGDRVIADARWPGIPGVVAGFNPLSLNQQVIWVKYGNSPLYPIPPERLRKVEDGDNV